MKKLITLIPLFLVILNSQVAYAQQMNKALGNYVSQIVQEYDKIPGERQNTLKEIGGFILSELEEDNKADVIIICTHNSRRSQVAQAWLQTAAIYYGVSGVYSFSGGLEATAFHRNAIAALERAGFFVSASAGDNPGVTVKTGGGMGNWLHYSKKYTNRQNPQEDFGAIMVCSDADKSCPLVEGADQRFSLPYKDPRYYDDTPSEVDAYDQAVKEIGREMFFLANYVKENIIIKKEAKK